MNPLKSYFKKTAPDYTDLQRNFDGFVNETAEPVCRLIITPDVTLTSLHKPAWYRANQAEVFINMNSAIIENIFHYGHIISYDTIPYEDKEGNFINTMAVWVRKKDVDTAIALLSQQNWVSNIVQDRTCIVRPNGFEKTGTLNPMI